MTEFNIPYFFYDSMNENHAETENCSCDKCKVNRFLIGSGKFKITSHYVTKDQLRHRRSNQLVQQKRREKGIGHFKHDPNFTPRQRKKSEGWLGTYGGGRNATYKKTLELMLTEQQLILRILTKKPYFVVDMSREPEFFNCIDNYCREKCKIDHANGNVKTRHVSRIRRNLLRMLANSLIIREKANIMTSRHTSEYTRPNYYGVKLRNEVVSSKAHIHNKAVWMYSINDKGVINSLFYKLRKLKLRLIVTWCKHCDYRQDKKIKGVHHAKPIIFTKFQTEVLTLARKVYLSNHT